MYKTLFILDWDDTLFPTNWIVKNGINLATYKNNNNKQYIVYFKELDNVLTKFLTKILKLGKVIIVTNALKDWVNISSYMVPNTYKLLKTIEIISAREKYRHMSPEGANWKLYTFRDIAEKEFNNNTFMNIISIGDAEYEYNAVIALNKQNTHIKKYIKAIKFMKEPSHDMLIDQLEVLNMAIFDIYDKKNHLDLKIDRFSNIR